MHTSAYVRGQPDAVFIVDHAPLLALSPIVIGELKSGFALGSKEEENRAQLRRLCDSPRVVVPSLDESVTDAYASLFAQLKREGRPIPTNDLWISAFALRPDAALYSLDNHFRHVRGLCVVRDRPSFERVVEVL